MAAFAPPVAFVDRSPRPGTFESPVADEKRDCFGPGLLLGTGDRAYGFKDSRSSFNEYFSNRFSKVASVPPEGSELLRYLAMLVDVELCYSLTEVRASPSQHRSSEPRIST